PHALREQVVLALRQHADHTRQLAARPAAGGTPQDLGATGDGPYQAEGRTHQRCLAAAVRSQHGVALARAHLERASHPTVARGVRVAARDAAQGEDQLTVHRRSRNANTGTPSRAVTIPTGSSRGAATVRASVSAAASRIPPVRNAVGSKVRCSRPHTRRQTCGTTSPTKPITPATATAAAVRSDAAR